MVYLNADTVFRSYGLLEKPDRTGKKASVFGTGCFVNRPVPGATGPVIYGGTDVIWSTGYTINKGRILEVKRDIKCLGEVTVCSRRQSLKTSGHSL